MDYIYQDKLKRAAIRCGSTARHSVPNLLKSLRGNGFECNMNMTCLYKPLLYIITYI